MAVFDQAPRRSRLRPRRFRVGSRRTRTPTAYSTTLAVAQIRRVQFVGAIRSSTPSRISRRTYCGAPLQDHRHIDGHAETVVRPAGKTAGDGNGLADVPGDADADQVGAVDRPVCRIVSDPAGPRKVDIGPRMGRANARGIAAVGGGIVEIPG